MKPQREQRWRLLHKAPLPHGYVKGGQGRSQRQIEETVQHLTALLFIAALALVCLWILRGMR